MRRIPARRRIGFARLGEARRPPHNSPSGTPSNRSLLNYPQPVQLSCPVLRSGQTDSSCHRHLTASSVRGVAQSGSAPGSGPGGRRFESSRPDHSSEIHQHRNRLPPLFRAPVRAAQRGSVEKGRNDSSQSCISGAQSLEEITAGAGGHAHPISQRLPRRLAL